MGAFISTISQPQSSKLTVSETWCESLQKIKEYHGMFKYVCDSFIITSEQCKEIFGNADKCKIWDPDNIGKIDALEIFCGLTVFARDATWKRKLSFLFSIFDFNQIKSLGFIDVEVIVLNVCNSAYKILGKNGKANQNQIADWLSRSLYKKQRVKITKLYKLCLQNEDIAQFFKTINQLISQPLQFPTRTLSQQQSQSSCMLIPSSSTNQYTITVKQRQQIIQNVDWHRDLINRIVKVEDIQNYQQCNNNINNYFGYRNQIQTRNAQNQNNKNGYRNYNYFQNNYGCKISWVYGINIKGLSRPFICLRKMGGQIGYRISSMLVVQNMELGKQSIMQGHQQQISCIAYNQKYEMFASAASTSFPSVYIWQKIGAMSNYENTSKFHKVSQIATTHSHGIKFMQFIARQTLLATVGARQQQSPILIYDFLRSQVVYQIILPQSIIHISTPLALVQKSTVTGAVYDSIFCLAQDHSKIYQINLKPRQKLGSQLITFKPTQIVTQHYYTLQSATQYNNNNENNTDGNNSNSNNNDDKILSVCSVYCNVQNPYLRSHCDKSISMAVLTGHHNRSVCMLRLSAKNTKDRQTSKYRDIQNQDSRHSGVDNQNKNASLQQKQQKIIISDLDGPVSCLKVTSQVLVVAAGSCIYVYDLEILNNKAAPLLMANLRAQQKVQLLSERISYFDFVQNYILAMTEKGQFLKVQTHRSIRAPMQRNSTINRTTPGYIDESNQNEMQSLHSQGTSSFTENLQVTMIDKLIKFQVLNTKNDNQEKINNRNDIHDDRSSCSHTNIFCILNLNPSMSQQQPHQLLLFVSSNNRILGIDSLSRDIMELWEINAAQTIVTLDAACSDEGSCYVICGCRSGRLYIRIDWEQNPKFYDCGSEIVDAKISKDCSYLLVATKSNYLLFFAQVNKVFTSPRKLLFEYETPCSINFLDNFKFFLIVTSAKNCYLIQIPQLKHKKLHKQTQKISISKISIKYPYVNQKMDSAVLKGVQQAQNNSGNQSRNNINFSTSILGGNMKFSLISYNLLSNNLYFFPSPSALQRNTFTILNAHKCPIAHMVVNEHQNKFYTLGDCDNMLVQWSVFTNRFQDSQALQRTKSQRHRNNNNNNRNRNNYQQYNDDDYEDSHYRNIRSKCNIQPSNVYLNFQEMQQYDNFEQFINKTTNLNMNSDDNTGRNGSGNISKSGQLYYFKGTKLQKINQNIQKYYQSYISEAKKKSIAFIDRSKQKQMVSQKQIQSDAIINDPSSSNTKQQQKQIKQSNPAAFDQTDKQSFNKRAPGVSLHAEQVYGLSTINKDSICYCNGSNGDQVLGYNSRFVIRMNIKQKMQILYQLTSKCINNVIRLQYAPNYMLYTVVELRPRVYVLQLNTDACDIGPVPKNKCIQTTHEKGIMHMTARDQFVLSYGISQKGYSLNLHNFMTGQLILNSYTDIKVSKFLVLPINNNNSGRGSSRPASFTMVSLPEVRVWQQLYPSEPIALATSGCILPNGHDILLGLDSGKLLILDTRKSGGLHQIQSNAHQKAIDFVAVKGMDCNNYVSNDDSFEIVTVGRDQKIKIWSSSFEVKVLIQFRHKDNLVFIGQNNKELLMLENIVAKSLDIYKNKLLLALSSGHISEIQLQNAKMTIAKSNDISTSKHANNTSNISQKSFTNQSISNQLQRQQLTEQQMSQFSMDQSNRHANCYGRTKFKWTNIFHIHMISNNYNRRKVTANSNNIGKQNIMNMTGHPNNRNQIMMAQSNNNSANTGNSYKQIAEQPWKAQYFTINNLYPLIATCGEDNQVIIRNYETGQVVYKCYYQKQRVQAVKFCKRGTKIAIGFNTGDIKLYQIKVYKDTMNTNSDNININIGNMNATNVRNNARSNTYINKKGKIDNVILKLYQTIQQCETNSQSQNIGKQASKYPHSDSSKADQQSSHNSNSNQKQYIKHNRNNNNNSNISYDRFKIVNIQFSQCSKYLAVSYIYMYDQVTQRCRSSIAMYKIRQSSKVGTINNIAHNNIDVQRDRDQEKMSMKNIQSYDQLQLQYYVKVGATIHIQSGDQDMNMTHSSKYIKSAYFMTFMKQSQPIDNNNHENVESGRKLNIPKSNLQPMKAQVNQKFQRSQMYLLFYEQYIDMNKQRVHNDNKIKLKVYQVQDGPSVKQDYNINLLKWKFPHFVDARAVQGVTECSTQNKRNSNGNSKQIQGTNQDQIRFSANQDKAELSVIVSDMLIYDQMVIYGDTNGKIHILKINSLHQDKNQSENQQKPQTAVSSLANRLELSEMSLSKTYNSNIGPISQIELSSDRRYLFVSGTTDNCIVKYRIKAERSDQDLDSICYSLNFKDVHGEYICKSKFYQFLNSIDPIREQISEIMLDVQDHNKNNCKGVQLEPMRIFGRRAFDRRNNLFQDKRGNLIYSLGPNIIIQNPLNPLLQTHIPVDPNPYSNSPQISCMCYSCGYLVASTQEQNSRLFVWDISSKTCLQELCLSNFSIVYHMAPVSKQKIIFVYGINYLYEPFFQLIDWGSAKILGSYSGLYSGVWKIKDVCQVSNLAVACISNTFTSSLDFVSCGVQHLMHWTYTAENLQCQTFGLADLQMKQITFMCVSNLSEIIIAGAENGIIYGFSGLQCVLQLKMHMGPIRSIVLDYGITQGNSYAYSNVMVYTGGMDGKVCVSGISLDENQNYVIRKLQEYSIKSRQSKASHMASAHKQSRMKKFSSNQIEPSMISAQSDIILAEEDIQSLVISKCLQTNQNTKIPMVNIYIGTRSGNILLVKRQSVPSIIQNSNSGVGNRKQIGTSNNLSNIQSTKQISRRNSSGGAHSMQKFAITGEPTLITSCHDNDTISSLVFSEQNPNIFYLLTSSGVLQVWLLLTMKRIFIYKLSQQAKKIFTFGQYVIICCEKSIRTVKIDLEKLSVNYVTAMSKDYDGSITDCCMSKIVQEQQNTNTNSNARPTNSKSNNKNESQESEEGRTQNNNDSKAGRNIIGKMSTQYKDKGNKKFIYFVVSLKKSQFSEILISTITLPNQQSEVQSQYSSQPLLDLKFSVLNLKYELQFMDFSVDNKYLLFKDSFEELGMVNLQNFKRINTIFVEMGIQWQGEGIRISPNGQMIYCSYSRENRITVLRRISKKQIIVGDEMGTLRIFEYPCPNDKIGELHTQCYTSHMNFIKNIEIHPTLPFALTTSIYDSSLILWKIIRGNEHEENSN